MKTPKIMPVFGTRPEAIKMAPVIKKLKTEKSIKTVVTVTAQHREMLDQVLDLFDIKVDYDLDLMKKNQSLTGLTGRILKKMEQIYLKEKPDLVLIHGDTTTTFSGALASFYQKIKIGHIEAGLRTNNKYFPYPEEMNRHLTGVLADIHFAPTDKARKNLIAENIARDNIYVTGNTVIDSMQEIVRRENKLNISELNDINFNSKKIILLTTHRRENMGQPMREIFKAVKEIVENNPQVELIFPVHLNPKIRNLTEKLLKPVKRIHLIEPLGYESFVNLMAKSELILTDSGGVQEEAPGLGKPVLVLRENSERLEAVKAGTVKKVGTDKEKIINNTQKLLDNQQEYKKMAKAINPYGDGNASQRIINRILFEFRLQEDSGKEFKI